MTDATHVVITVHGIRTFGQWQTRLAEMLQSQNPAIEVHNYTYGYFSIIAFLLPPLRWLVTRRFRKCLEEILCGREVTRVDLVGHSFGTHLIGWALKQKSKNKLPPIHTVILAGSVLRPTYDWSELFTSTSVGRVINECGIHDNILVVNQLGVLFTGMAGRLGFQGMTGRRLFNRHYIGGHSLYFEKDGMPIDSFMQQQWLPLLLSEAPVAVRDERNVPTAWDGIVTTALQNSEGVKLAIYTVVLLIPAAVFAGLRQQAADQRDIAEEQRQLADEQRVVAESERLNAVRQRDVTLDTLQWVFNQSATIDFDTQAAVENDELVRGTLERLVQLGYDGTIRMEAHVGLFRFVDSELFPDVRLLTNELAAEYPNLEVITYSQEYAVGLGSRMSSAFTDLGVSLGLPANRIETISYGATRPLLEYPADEEDINEWNRIASLNNRVQISLQFSGIADEAVATSE